MQQRRGFTLIEVLIVITIVGSCSVSSCPGMARSRAHVGALREAGVGSILAQGRATAIQTDQTVLVVRTGNVVSLIA